MLAFPSMRIGLLLRMSRFGGLSPAKASVRVRWRVITWDLPTDYLSGQNAQNVRDVVLLMVTFLVYAWCVTDDLQVVPKRGGATMQTSHHGEVFVDCSNEARLESVIAYMVKRWFPPLREEQARAGAQASKDCVWQPVRRLELSKRLASFGATRVNRRVEFLRAQATQPLFPVPEFQLIQITKGR